MLSLLLTIEALQGIVKNGVEGNVIATLPAACRPKNLLIFGSIPGRLGLRIISTAC